MKVCNAVLAAAGTMLVLVGPSAILGQEANNLTGHATNLATTDTVVNFTNTGSSWNATVPIPNGSVTGTGSICVNIYALNSGGLVDWCCQCVIAPNQLSSFSVNTDIPHGADTSLTIKMIATIQGTGITYPAGLPVTGSSASCDATHVNAGLYTAVGPLGVTTSINALASGLVGWGRSQVNGGVGTESLFATGQISTAEVANLNTQCSGKKPGGAASGYCSAAGAFSGAPATGGACRLGGS